MFLRNFLCKVNYPGLETLGPSDARRYFPEKTRKENGGFNFRFASLISSPESVNVVDIGSSKDKNATRGKRLPGI